MMRSNWNLGLHRGCGWAAAIGLIATSLLLPLAAVHADSSATISVNAEAGPFVHYNKGLSNGSTIDPTGSDVPAATGLKVTATTTDIWITYNGGTITLFSPDPSRNPAFTPDGKASGSNSLPFGIPKDTTPVPLTSARYAQLLYRIGLEGKVMAVPFGAPLSSPVDIPHVPSGDVGKLYLFINDTQYYDNNGAYKVSVTLTDPSGTDPNPVIHNDGTATPEAPAGLLLAVGMVPLAGLAAWRRKRTRGSQAEV